MDPVTVATVEVRLGLTTRRASFLSDVEMAHDEVWQLLYAPQMSMRTQTDWPVGLCGPNVREHSHQ